MTTLPDPDAFVGSALKFIPADGAPPMYLLLTDVPGATPYFQFLGVDRPAWIAAAQWDGEFVFEDVEASLTSFAMQQISERAIFRESEANREFWFLFQRDPDLDTLMQWPPPTDPLPGVETPEPEPEPEEEPAPEPEPEPEAA